MRVIAGEKRHLLLKTLNDLSIRPTTDKIKETLFNMIQFDIAGSNFLDLFAGTGAIGIEALSRGANFACFVDNSPASIKVINENLEHTKLIDRARVLRRDASSAIDELEREEKVYNIVFMDPPYDKKLYVPVFERLEESKIINNETTIILETNLKDDVSELEKLGFIVKRVKEYKTNKHVFLHRRGEHCEPERIML